MSLVLIVLSAVVACPAEIRTNQEVVGLKDQGWAVHTQMSSHRLDVGTLFQGHPSKVGAVMGLPTKGGMEWKIYKGEFWMRCTYRGTHLHLIRRIETPATCVATKAVPLRNIPATFQCQKGK